MSTGAWVISDIAFIFSFEHFVGFFSPNHLRTFDEQSKRKPAPNLGLAEKAGLFPRSRLAVQDRSFLRKEKMWTNSFLGVIVTLVFGFVAVFFFVFVVLGMEPGPRACLTIILPPSCMPGPLTVFNISRFYTHIHTHTPPQKHTLDS